MTLEEKATAYAENIYPIANIREEDLQYSFNYEQNKKIKACYIDAVKEFLKTHYEIDEPKK